ncbi:MAG: type II secretion system protein [Armatimonadetes bacterium]|nr:type II secretion system protein [Armatimonadota bacterium]
MTPVPVAPNTHRPPRGFTLTEILVAIGVLAILAAILFPILFQVRNAARRVACQSNLMQFGIAFKMYAADYDGRFPNPGGREFRQPLPRNGAAWYSATRDPITNRVTDSGTGVFPYLRQRGNGGSNLWSCPNALPGSGRRQYDVGQNFAMNDYLRAAHPGQAVTAWGAPPASYWPAFQTGINPEVLEAGPAGVILLFEVVQSRTGGVNRDGSVYFSSPNLGGSISRYGAHGLPIGAPEEYHSGNSTFLFCDGHVKTMKPAFTWTTATQAAVERFNSAYVNAQPGAPRRGSGSQDLWNPQASAVTYP